MLSCPSRTLYSALQEFNKINFLVSVDARFTYNKDIVGWFIDIMHQTAYEHLG
jgi:hypothetical protein